MNVKIPEMAKGTIVPPYIYQKMKEDEEKQMELEELKRIAQNTDNQLKLLQEQLDFQLKESQEAKAEAKNSKTLSILAIVVSIILAIFPLFF